MDIVASYLTPAEFSNIQQCCVVKEVFCEIRILGVCTSFDVGTTLTGSANSEHVPIGMHPIGLIHILQLSNVTYETNAEKPMIPTNVKSFSTDDYLKKLYNSEGAAILGCPPSNSNYLTYSNNKPKSNTNSYIKHTKQDFMLDYDVINKFHVGSHVAETIVKYSYKPHMGYLNCIKQYTSDTSVTEVY